MAVAKPAGRGGAFPAPDRHRRRRLAEGGSDDFYRAKLAMASSFAAYAAEITDVSASMFALPEKLF